MILEVRSMLPASVEFVVLADSFFDSKQIFDACNEIKAIYITPADSARVHSRIKKTGKERSYTKEPKTRNGTAAPSGSKRGKKNM